MRFLLLGNGKTIKSIKKYIKHKKDNYIQAVNKNELTNKRILLDDKLLQLNDIDYAIKSPGIKETDKLYLKLANKFTFISELDLLKIYKEKIKTIVITGSNGKTTFVSMLTFILNKANKKVISCGNSFKPITHYYKLFDKLDYLIIEQSSFQLHDLKFYNPYISIILNIQENHLDDSYSFNSYKENKLNLLKYQNKNNYYIYDEIKPINNNVNNINLLKYEEYNIKSIYKKNIDYIYTIFKLLNIDIKYIKYINDFKYLKYRFEKITKNGVIYINDSKSTSVDATLFAIDNLNKQNKILIIGGKDKNLSLSRLQNKADFIICYGQLLDKAMKNINNVIPTKTLKEAFLIAKNIDLSDKIILFSPAASSFDQFKSFEDRGKYFNYLIKKYG